jgi:hypothetical protein
MLTYHLINNRPDLTRLIWNREQKAPQFFRDASAVWHPTFADFEAFWQRCEIYGLFDVSGKIADVLLACIYIEHLDPFAINVHISVVDKVPEADLVRFFVSVKNKKAIEGITEITGWILKQNKGMRRTGEAAGFRQNGVTMIYGVSKNRPLVWLQYRAV